MNKYEMVMGLEIHVAMVGLDCKMKAFSSAKADNDELVPNSNIDYLDFGLPGSLPVYNTKITDLATQAGLALNCQIQKLSIFDDKNYMYPDNPCGRQITQYYHPIALGGYVPIPTESDLNKSIALNRIHIEQDAGKNVHDIEPGATAVDFNRAGIGLLEIVTEPCIYEIADLGSFLKSLRAILRTIKVSNCNMERGEMRADLSLSIRKKGDTQLGTRAEIKNINSVTFVQKAAQYEFDRQVSILEKGGSVLQETRRFDPKTNTTISMRLKEDADEYLYLPDYNLPPLILTDEYIDAQRAAIPKLPQELCNEIVAKGVSWANAYIITSEPEYFDFFNKVIEGMNDSQIQTASKLMIGDLFGLLNNTDRDLLSFNPQWLKELTILTESKTISSKITKELLLLAFEKDISPQSQATANQQVSNIDEITTIVELILQNYPDEIARYKSGKTNLLGFFTGKVMQQMKNANPVIVGEVVKNKLSA